MKHHSFGWSLDSFRRSRRGLIYIYFNKISQLNRKLDLNCILVHADDHTGYWRCDVLRWKAASAHYLDHDDSGGSIWRYRANRTFGVD